MLKAHMSLSKALGKAQKSGLAPFNMRGEANSLWIYFKMTQVDRKVFESPYEYCNCCFNAISIAVYVLKK